MGRSVITPVSVVSPTGVNDSEMSDSRDDRRPRGLGVDIYTDKGTYRTIASCIVLTSDRIELDMSLRKPEDD